MSWESPAWLLLALAALPILVLARREAARPRAVPSLAFFGETQESRARRRHRPPLWAWCAAAASLLAALAAAGPRSGAGETLTIVLDASVSMRRVDAAGARRFDRAIGAAREILASVPSSASVRLRVEPGPRVEGTPGEARALLDRAKPTDTVTEIDLAEVAGRTVVLTGSAAPFDRRAEVRRFGASRENAGFIGAWADRARGDYEVVVANGGLAPAERTIAGAPLRLNAGEARVVASRGNIALGGGPDALAADDALELPPLSRNIEIAGDPPEALARALAAAQASVGASSGARLELATEFRRRRWRAVEGTVAAELDLPREAPAAAVRAASPWIVDAETGEALLGTDEGLTARCGLDFSAPELTGLPAAPVLIAALVEAIASAPLLPTGGPAPFDAVAESDPALRVAAGAPVLFAATYRSASGRFTAALLDPRATLEPGATADSVEAAAEPGREEAARSFAGLFGLAAAGASAAACAASRGRWKRRGDFARRER